MLARRREGAQGGCAQQRLARKRGHGTWSARVTSFAAPPSREEGRKKPRVSGEKVDMDEVGDDVGEARHWENVAWDGESDDELDEDSDEELDGESHEESE